MLHRARRRRGTARRWAQPSFMQHVPPQLLYARKGLAAILTFILTLSPVLPSINPLRILGALSSRASVLMWDGGGADNAWGTPQNWSEDRVPNADDIATFTEFNTKDVVVDTDVSVAGIVIEEGYSSHIELRSGKRITIGDSGFKQANGRFTATGVPLDVLGDFTISGGTFVAPSAELSIDGNFSILGEGTFEHNNGSVILNGLEQFIFGSPTFFNLTKIADIGQTLEFQSGKTILVEGTLRLKGAELFGNQGLLQLRPSNSEEPFILDARGSVDMAYLDLRDVISTRAESIVCEPGCADSGNVNGITVPELPSPSVIPSDSPAGEPESSEGLIDNMLDKAKDLLPDPSSVVPSNEPGSTPSDPSDELRVTSTPKNTVDFSADEPIVFTIQINEDSDAKLQPIKAETEGNQPIKGEPINAGGEGRATSGEGNVIPAPNSESTSSPNEASEANNPAPSSAPTETPKSPEKIQEKNESFFQFLNFNTSRFKQISRSTVQQSLAKLRAYSLELIAYGSSTALAQEDSTPQITSAEVVGPDGSVDQNIQPELVTVDGQIAVHVPKPEDSFRPGRYTLKLTVEQAKEAQSYQLEQDFTWGVLAINTEKSSYKPNEEAFIAMGVVDDEGRTICDAQLELQITAPDGTTTNRSTSSANEANAANEAILTSDACGGSTQTDAPDYSTTFTPTQNGSHTLTLTATTKNGTRSITDELLVDENAPFRTVRKGPTRIYPPSPYRVDITLEAKDSFSGHVIEYVPSSFAVAAEGAEVYLIGDERRATRGEDDVEPSQLAPGTSPLEDYSRAAIVWRNVSLEAGSSQTFSYEFNAPNVSPQFYLLGKLELVTGDLEIVESSPSPNEASEAQPRSEAAASTTGANAANEADIVGATGGPTEEGTSLEPRGASSDDETEPSQLAPGTSPQTSDQIAGTTDETLAQAEGTGEEGTSNEGPAASSDETEPVPSPSPSPAPENEIPDSDPSEAENEELEPTSTLESELEPELTTETEENAAASANEANEATLADDTPSVAASTTSSLVARPSSLTWQEPRSWQIAADATLYWVGGAGESVHTASNWSTTDPGACNPGGGDASAAPGASDVATFDADCDNSAVIDANWSVGGIAINSGHTGTLTQNATRTLTVGSSGWTQADGTFTGGNSSITVTSAFTLSGGAFTSTSGTATFNQNYTNSGGTFTHNSGTVLFSGPSSSSATINVNTSETFNNLTIRGNGGGGTVYTISSGDTLVALGTLALADSGTHLVISTGTIEPRGNVTFGSFLNSSSATLSFLVTGDQTITTTGTPIGGPNLNISKSSGIVSVIGNVNFTSFTLTSGTFTSTTGTLGIAGSWTHTAGGTFNHNSGTILFAGGTTATLDVATAETFNNLTFNKNQGGATLNIASGDTLIVEGTLRFQQGTINTGAIEAKGNVQVDSTVTIGDGSASLVFSGTANQTYTDSGGKEVNGDITINKTAGTVTLASNAEWNATSQDVTITDGTLDTAGFTLSTNTLTVTDKLIVNTPSDVTSSSETLNAGSTVEFQGDGDSTADTYTITGLAATYENLIINGTDSTDIFQAGATLTANDDLTITSGILSLNGQNLTVSGANTTFSNDGTMRVQGGETISNLTFDSNSGTAEYVGTSTYTDLILGDSYNNLTFNGSTGSWTLDAALSVTGSLNITAGGVAQGSSHTLTTGAVTIGTGGGWFSTGGDITLSGDVTNNGYIHLDGSGAGCGGTDDVVITSSVASTQRTWTNNGTVRIYDVDATDQAGTITAYSSTSTSNNGWTFDGTCPANEKFWDGGGGDNNWNTGGNWSGDTAPASTDVAVFDGLSAKAATINTNISVAGMEIRPGTSTITQASTRTVTVGTSGWTQSGGTFTGGDSTVDINGAYTLSGGSFTATSGNWTHGGTLTISGGTFTHNSGTLITDQSTDQTINVGSASFNNVTITKLNGIIITGTLDVNGNLALTQSLTINGGTITVAGNVTTTDLSNGGTATIIFDGTGAQTLSAGGGTGAIPNITINKSSGTLTIQDTLEFEGTNWTHTIGTVDAGTSTVEFRGASQVVTTNGMSFYNFSIPEATNSMTITGTLDVNGNFSIAQIIGINGDPITIAGNISSTDTAVAGTSSITLDGTGNQTITLTGSGSGNGDLPNGTFTINKASGKVTLGANMNLNGSQAFNITSGQFDQGASYTLTTSGATTVGSSGSWVNRGTGDIVLGGNVTNNGWIHFNGGGLTCGTDEIAITSSAGGTQRTWTNNGSYRITDIAATDQAGSITAIDSTNTSNNAWTFSGTCVAEKVWDHGAADNTWSTAANWTDDAAPGTSDLVIFDNTSTANANIAANISILGIYLTPAYSGTVTQNSTRTVTVGSSGWTQSGGTFTGGNSTIDVNSFFTLSGGTFTATSGTLQQGREVDNENFTISGGTFNHNSGTIEFTGFTKTLNISSATLNNVTINMTSNRRLFATGTIDINGTLTVTSVHDIETTSSANFNLAGNIVTTDDFNGGAAGDPTFTLDGTGDQTISASGATGSIKALIINKASGTVTFEDTIRIRGTVFTHTAGTVDTGTSTIIFAGSETTVSASGVSFNNVTISITDNTRFNVTGTMDINGDLTFTLGFGVRSGTITVAGDITSTDTSLGGEGNSGATAFTLDGTGAQTITATNASLPAGNFTINKAAGTVSLGSAVSLNNTGQDLTVTQGTLALAGNNLTVNDVLTVGSTGTLQLNGNETVTAGTKTISSGSIVRYVGDNDAASDSYTLNQFTSANKFAVVDGIPGLVSWWKMDETANDTCSGGQDVCDSTSSNHGSASGSSGTNTSGAAISTTVAPLSYTNSRARDFDGTDDIVSVPDDASLNFGGDNFAVSLWVNSTTTANSDVFISKRDGIEAGWIIQYRGGENEGDITAQLENTSGNSISISSSESNLNDGVWHHVLLTTNGTNSILYIDGVSSGTGIDNGNLDSTANLWLGNWTGIGDYYDGLMDDVRIYNRALTAAEAAALASGSLAFDSAHEDTFTLGNNLDVNNTFDVSGGTFAQGDYTLNVAEDFTIQNGATFTKSSNGSALTLDGDLIFKDNNSTKQDMGDLFIGTSPDTTDLASDLVATSLTVQAGDVLNTNGYDVDITNDITIAGTFDATDDIETDTTEIFLGGDWANTGTFTASDSDVTFDGTAQTISGSTTFFDFSKTEGGNNGTSETLTFEAGSTQTITGTWTLTGTDIDDRIVLTSSTGASAWNVDVSGGTYDLSIISVAWSTSQNGSITVCEAIDNGNNTNWNISGVCAVSGTVYSDEGSTALTDKTVRVAVNGTDHGTTDESDASTGAYAIEDLTVENNDVLTIYLEDEPENAVTVTVADGVNLTGFNLYQDRLITRCDNACSLTNANLSTATVSGEADVSDLYSVSSGNLTMTSTNSNGLAGWWKFDEGTGTSAADSSGNGETGTLVNDAAWVTSIPTLDFTNSYALELDGTDGHVNAGTTSDLQNFTICAWVNPDEVVTENSIFNKTASEGTTNDIHFAINTAAKLSSTINDGNTTASSTSISTDTWTHVCVTNEIASTRVLYINGSPDATASSIDPNANTSHTTYIGRDTRVLSSNDREFDGTIDDVRIFTRALAESEIASLAAGNLTHKSELFVPSSHTFAPGGDIDVGDIDVNGTLTLAANDATVSGTWDATGGSFTTSGQTMFTGTGTESDTITSNGQSFQNVIVNDGLVGYWKLDETSSGTFADSSGYGNTGTGAGASGGNNTPQPSSTVPTLNFTNTRSLDFDGTDDYVSIPDANQLDLTNTGAVSIWAKVDSVTGKGTPALIRKIPSGGDGLDHPNYEIATTAASTSLRFAIGQDGTSSQQISSGEVSLGQWHHLSMTWDGTTFSAYKDGTLLSSAAQTLTPSTGTGILAIGSQRPFTGTSIRFTDGQIDDVRVYNRALSATEIARLAAGNQPETGLATYTLEDALDVNGDLTLNAGTLDTNSGESNAIDVASSWLNHGGKLTANSNTVTLSSTATGKTLLSGNQQFYNLTASGAAGGWTLADDLYVGETLTQSAGTLSTSSDNHSIYAGHYSKSAGTFTSNSSKLTLDHSSAQTYTVSDAHYDLHIGDSLKYGLVGYWKLDEAAAGSCTGSLDACDSSGSANHGTWGTTANTSDASDPTVSTDVPTVKYTNARSLDFDGTDDRVRVADPGGGELDFGASDSFSYGGWFKGTGGELMNKGGEDQYYDVHIGVASTPGRVQARMNDGVNSVFQSSTWDGPTDTWRHVMIVVNRSTNQLKLYGNGKEQGSAINISSLGSLANDNQLTLGSRDKNGNNGTFDALLNGQLDDVRIYNRALSAEEIRHMASGGHKYSTATTATYTLGAALDVSNDLQLNEGTLDSSGSNYNVTVGGSWLNHEGTFTPNSNTVTLDALSGTKDIASNGSSFNHLAVGGGGLVGYWKFDESSGTSLADSSGNNNTGTATGASGTNTSGPAAAADVASGFDFTNNYSRDFDGTDDYVDTPSISLSTTHAFAMWIKVDNATFEADLAAGDNAGTYIGTDQTRLWYRTGFGSTNLHSYTSPTPLSANTWYHLTFSRSGTSAEIYLNGVKQGSTLTLADNNSFTMSRISGGGALGVWDGDLDDVRVYNRALSATEITNLAAGSHTSLATWELEDALDVNGDLTISAGTVDAKSGENNNINVGGAWTNNDTFISQSNTVTFDGSSVTKTIIPGGTGTGNDFHNLTFNASGSTYTLEDSLDADNNITLVEGTVQTDKDETSNVTAGATLNVQDGGAMIVRRSSTTGEGAGQTITAGTLTIDSGGTVNADSEGFAAQAGPGANTGDNQGGTHGGVGFGNPSATYGSFTNPTSLGSGGVSGAGGGAIIISSTGTVTVNGTLSANSVGGNESKAGAGGSINITANTLTGTGTIEASSATVSTYGGGGGRISLNGVTTDTFTGTLQAKYGTTTTRGRSGTIYLNSTKRTSLTLGGGGNLSTLRLGSDDNNNYTFGTITIQNGGTLEIDGNPNMNSGNGGAAVINVTTLDVQSGGTLTANQRGFHANAGPGTPGADNRGGTYGGEGTGNTVATYGSLTNPLVFGSGGQDRTAGGVIRIAASGAITVDGTITANGEDSLCKAGSGGSINISADSISGSGTMRANGGSCPATTGSGGGGRVAVSLTTGTTFGSISYQAFGGTASSASSAGAAGTVYLKDANDAAGDGELIIDNNSVATTSGIDTLISSSVTDTAVGTVTIRNSGKLQMAADTTLTVSGDWTDNVGTTLSAGTVDLDGVTQAINGSAATTFNNLSKTEGADDETDETLTFPASTTTSINGALTLQGTDKTDRINLVSSSPATAWNIDVATPGTEDVDFVSITDSNNTSGSNLTACQSEDGGGNTAWDIYTTCAVSGTVYSDEGTTALTNKTVRVGINGTDHPTTDDSDASTGAFAITDMTAVENDVLTFYLEDEPENAVTITVTDGINITGFDLYQDRLITRHDNAGSITNANLSVGTVSGEDDITAVFTVSGGNLTVGGNDDAGDTGLVGYWKFDETANDTCSGAEDACDSSGEGHHGTATGTSGTNTSGPAISTTVPTLNYTNSRSRDFDGTDDIVTVTNTSALQLGDGDMAVSVWIYPDSLSNKTVYAKAAGGSTREYMFSFSNASTGFLSFGNGGGTSVSLSTAFTTGAWQHLLVTRSGSNVTVYKNGTSVGTATQSATGTSSANFIIGDDPDGAHWDGLLDEVRIYNRALTATEAADLANGGDKYELFVPSSHTFAPGGDIDVGDVDVNGTLTMSSNDAVVSGTWDATGGSFTTSGQTMFTGSANVSDTITSDGDSFQNVIINDGLVGYWKLDETADNSCSGGEDACDSSGYGSHGTATGASGTNTSGPAISDTKPTVNFTNAKARDFDSTDDIITVTDNAALQNIFDGGGTLSAWARTESAGEGNHGRIAAKRSSAGWDAFAHSSGLRIGLSQDFSGTDAQWTSGNVLTTSTWYQVTMTYNSDSVSNDPTFYVNGASVSITEDVTPVGTRVSDVGSDVTIGNLSSTARTFDGQLDDVRIYDRALSAEEIARLAAGNQPETSVATYTLEDALDINGDLTLNAGTLDTNSGESNAIDVASSWLNNGGKFTANSNTVTLSSTATGKTLLSGNQQFYNLTASGAAGGWTLADDLYVGETITQSAGTLDTDSTNNHNIYTGNFSKSGGTYTNNNSKLTLDHSSNQTFTLSDTLYDLHVGDSLKHGLQGYWKLDETAAGSCTGSLDACDSSGNANHGTWGTTANSSDASDPTVSSTVPTLKYTNARSLDFDGTDDNVRVEDNATLDITDNITLSAWVRSEGTQQQFAKIVHKYKGDANYPYQLNFEGASDDKLTFHLSDGVAEYNATSQSDITQNAWIHVVGTYDGSVLRLYVNGDENSTASASFSIETNNQYLGIGGRDGGTIHAFNGKIDDVRVYNRALTAEEIRHLASGGMKYSTSTTATYTLGSNLDINNDMQFNQGSVTAGTRNMTVAGDWNNYTGGTSHFTAGTGTVTFDGTDHAINGDNTFYNFTKVDSASDAADQTLTFQAAKRQTISNTWTLTGLGVDDRINLRSSSSPTQWEVDPQGTRNLTYIDVADSNNVNATVIALCEGDAIDPLNNNTNWEINFQFTQNDWRWYVDSDSENVTDPWGNPDLDENELMTVVPASNDPIQKADEIRARLNVTAGCTAVADSVALKLQYTQSADCTDGGNTWTDVGAGGSGAVWRYATSSVSDGEELTVAKLSTTDTLQSYVKSSSSPNNPNELAAESEGEWDFHIEHNGATDAATYCFRAVESGGEELTAYNSDSFPKLETRPGTANILRHGKSFIEGIERGFLWAD